MKSPPDAHITKPATAPPTKAENERPSSMRKTLKAGSAVMLEPLSPAGGSDEPTEEGGSEGRVRGFQDAL